ncbi:hypothetical protein CVT26_004389, partial [Gymnopilus dilepis]
VKSDVYQLVATKLAADPTKYKFTVAQIKSRWQRLKGAYKVVNYLRGLSGFGWDDATQCVTATDDVWKGLLYDENGQKRKKFNDYNYWRTHSFKWYDEMAALVGDTVACGDQAFSSALGSAAPQTAPEDDGTDDIQLGADAAQSTEDSLPNMQPSTADPGAAEKETQVGLDKDAVGLSASGSVSTVAATPLPKKASQPGKHVATPPGSPAAKRAHPTSVAQIGRLVDCVGKLVDVFVSPTKPAPPPPTSGLSRRELAWNTVKAEEGLSPYSLAKAHPVFREGDEVVEEYLSFDNSSAEEREARSFWLSNKMGRHD